jgi:RHH-type proline utilization regulon transcriptional repressor/proline dehydrogenase/delta 1-pyrroline-5-carboxylate dehydrogenase
MRNAASSNSEATQLAGNYVPFSALHAEIRHDLTSSAALRAAIGAAYRRDEREAVLGLLQQTRASAVSQTASATLARRLVQAVRRKRSHVSGVAALMQEFSLSSDEGIALMCLAEALLRIPDRQTADRLIADKISCGDWRKHLGESPSLFVNAATWGLLITGKLVSTSSEHGLGAALTKLIAKGGESLIRRGVDLAMRMLGNQFVTGRTIEEALANSRVNEARGYRYSYDMLGEAALTEDDAKKYYAAYEHAIHAIGRASNRRGIRQGPGISVKLSALHPRYSRAQRARVMQELLPRLKALLSLARHYDIGLNIDAEETDRLELSLDLMEALAFDPDLDGFEGTGFVVQAYQKRSPFVIDYLVDLARRSGRKFMVRLVKGAYWDTEIKRAQVDGMAGYPVYTRKVYTDLCYLACAQKLLANTDLIYPQFATHNARTLATIYTWAQKRQVTDYEFQCLHGMGEALYDEVVGKDHLDKACRIYAPVGSHDTLLAYLVRRLLENGANSSFVNQILDDGIAIDALIVDPFETAQQLGGAPHPDIPLPADLYGAQRKNSSGLDLSDENVLRTIATELAHFGARQWRAGPLLDGEEAAAPLLPVLKVLNPADHRDLVGHVIEADADDVASALARAAAYALAWQAVAPADRAEILARAADLLELHRFELMALAIREAGKSVPNAIAEVREAVDFLRYYAQQIHGTPNALALGPVVCISPWNFPLAIFIGEVSAALAAGNVVLAKPAEQTPLIAHRAVQLLHEAGVSRAALQFLPGRGDIVGAQLVADPRVRGVIFTGSTEVAHIINRTLAERAAQEYCEIPFIAETGGQNAMIVDSSALPEQVVQDVISSAFDSAGQRCSALRVLCLQTDIADKVLQMLQGALQELRIGNPDRLSTDVGPVIDAEAQSNLLAHIARVKEHTNNFFQPARDTAETQQGTFVTPTVLDIAWLSELRWEVFGPVLHVIRYTRDRLPQLVDAINATGYGLTLGIHSRIDETIDLIKSRAHVGNIYVNRNIVGAVVGVQPFGGEGMSGTGPKAGGPLYLKRLQLDTCVKFNTASEHRVSALPPDRPLLDALLAWSGIHSHQRISMLIEQYAGSTLIGTVLELPGPTGERNTLSFAPRGNVLCVATNTRTLLNQLAAVFATGNTACVLTAYCDLPANLPTEIDHAIRRIQQIESPAVELQFALLEAALAPRLLATLAARDGPVIPVLQTVEEDAIALWRLVVERAVCTNTAAVGGNAKLMMLAA